VELLCFLESLEMSADLQSRLKAAKDRYTTLTQQVTELKRQKLDGSLSKSASRTDIKATKIRSLECHRTFTGHNDNVTSIQWSGLESTFVSAGKDGQLIIWNGITRRQVQVIKHSTQWLMTCAYETRNNRLVATGGADRVCSVFVVGQIGMTHPVAELKGHDGYLSSARFIDDNNIITSSGDSSAVLWDISRVQSKQSFTEHAADCLTVSLHPSGQSFATGSADCTAKIWDIRSGKCTHTFSGHESDVNGVCFFPDGMAIGTAGTDSTCRMFDLRSFGQVAAFELSESQVPASSGKRSLLLLSLCPSCLSSLSPDTVSPPQCASLAPVGSCSWVTLTQLSKLGTQPQQLMPTLPSLSLNILAMSPLWD
jgi:guanine nucleotide-binding protein G(I)/G(S)/G(T) subunit beta-1